MLYFVLFISSMKYSIHFLPPKPVTHQQTKTMLFQIKIGRESMAILLNKSHESFVFALNNGDEFYTYFDHHPKSTPPLIKHIKPADQVQVLSWQMSYIRLVDQYSDYCSNDDQFKHTGMCFIIINWTCFK